MEQANRWNMEILAFFAGIDFAYTKSIYPLLLIFAALFLRAHWSLVIWFLTAILWVLFHQFWIADRGMPEQLVIAKALLQGRVTSIPAISPGKAQFQFAATSLDNKPVQVTLLLSCYQRCPIFKLGQVWQLQAKLRKPANLGNPGSFDYVSSLDARHIHWTGYIKLKPLPPELLEQRTHPERLLTLRNKLADSMAQLMPKGHVLGILQALTLGITFNVDKQQWDLFRRTGTTHLMVISGSHIGLVAGLTYWLIKWLWSRASRLCLYWPAIQVASIVAFCMSLAYALLAGFAAPTQRALVACFFLFLSHFLSQRFTVWQAWRYALLAVLLFEPHAVLMPGFYLSFIAVAILILVTQRFPFKGVKQVFCLQLACLLGLMPLTLYWFSYGAVNGMAANLLAIPWIEFVIVPLALVTMLVTQWLALPVLVMPVYWATEGLLYYLRWIDSFAWLNLDFSFTQLLSPLALMAAMGLLLLLPLRTILPAALVLGLAGLFPAYPRVKEGDAWIDVLDVGQGLAVVVNTARHTLVYDTGVKFYKGGDMGKLAIIPYLNTLGITKLDKVIISHPDLDHRGGLPSLQANYPIGELVVDQVAFYKQGTTCHHYPAWQWDGVFFRFFTVVKAFKDKNNTSCVLQVSNKKGKVLLTGDIEKAGEEDLLGTYGKQLRSTVLVVPHHGSKTSSSAAFIQQVSPQYAIISAGFDNRYHFPHQQTINTLQKNKVKIYNTADCGMVTIKLDQESSGIKFSCYNRGERQ